MQAGKLFLTGDSCIGKSYIINSVLGSRIAEAGGFRTVRLENGGLRYVLAEASCTDFERSGLCFLDYRVSPPIKNEEIFRVDAVKILEKAEKSPFAVLDETGGYELCIPEFCDALYRFLSCDTPCIGVLKGKINANELNKRFSLGNDYDRALEKLYCFIESRGDTKIVEVKSRGDENAFSAASSWADCVFGGESRI